MVGQSTEDQPGQRNGVSKLFLLLAALPAAIALPSLAQVDCSKFASQENRESCTRNTSTTTSAAEPYCLPVNGMQMKAIREGRTVVVPGVNGCSQVYNAR
jgi:hypothetical protein